jgi:hypothetical protein
VFSVIASNFLSFSKAIEAAVNLLPILLNYTISSSLLRPRI